MNFRSKVEVLAAIPKLMDTREGQPPEGFPEIDMPPKILAAINGQGFSWKKHYVRGFLYDDGRISLVFKYNNSFMSRHSDFKRLLDAGLIGFGYSSATEVTLYFNVMG